LIILILHKSPIMKLINYSMRKSF